MGPRFRDVSFDHPVKVVFAEFLQSEGIFYSILVNK